MAWVFLVLPLMIPLGYLAEKIDLYFMTRSQDRLLKKCNDGTYRP